MNVLCYTEENSAIHPCAHLLFHLLNFPDASSWLAVLVAQEVHVEISRLAELLLLLLFSILQFALCTDALSVVHVVCFHHLARVRQT